MEVHNFKLYNLANDYERFLDLIVNDEGNQDNESIEKALGEIKDLFEAKSINVAKYIKNLEVEYIAINVAISTMSERAKKVATRMETLTTYLKYNMEKTGLTTPIKCPEFIISIANNPPSIVIDNAEIIPDSYKITKEVISIDKAAIKKDIQDGLEVDGARIENKTRLVIK